LKGTTKTIANPSSASGNRRRLHRVNIPPVGNTLHVKPIALGTWAMGGSTASWGRVDDRESIAAIHQAIDLGVNLIDTAPIYGQGHSETVVGNAIQGRRDRVILATKCGLTFPRSPDDPPTRCLSRQRVIDECEASLRRLRTDTIDLYQCHWPDPSTPISETMSALTELLTQGKIRAIGLSNYAVQELSTAREFGPVHYVQSLFSMLHRRAADELVPYCLEHGIGFLAYSPLAKGLLTGKFDATSIFEGIRANDVDFVGSRYRRNLRLVDALRPIARSFGASVAQLVVAWTIAQPGITAAIIGAKRPSQVVENTGSASWPINDEIRNRVDHVLSEANREP